MSELSDAPRRIPAAVTYLHPFRIVESHDRAPWQVTIDEVNGGTWDYVSLHELAGGLDVGLPAPYHLVVGRDGALALPPIPGLRGDQQAVEFFNRCLAALLLGGVYCEAISPDNLEMGSIIDWKCIRVHRHALAASNRFHFLVRMRRVSPVEAIALMYLRTVELRDLAQAMKTGLAVTQAIPQLSGEFLLKGTSGIARRDWGAALANLWIVTEQITAHLWKHEIIAPASRGDAIQGRRDQLNDSRTWTAAARQKLLHQKGLISADALRDLYIARKARNDLSHSGKNPEEGAALAGYAAVLGLLRVSLPGEDLPLYSLNLADHALTDPFAPPPPLTEEPQYWLPIPKLPGEEELELEEARARAARGRARQPDEDAG